MCRSEPLLIARDSNNKTFLILFQNMTFQAEQKIKSQIIDALGTEQLFRLLSDPDPNILMKTLGLLRNLLSNKLVSDPNYNEDAWLILKSTF